MKRTSKIILWALIAVIVGLLFPFERTVTQDWSMKIVDDHGEPIPNCIVEQRWRWQAIDDESHVHIATTDSDGGVQFARQTVRANLAWEAFGHLRYALSFHAPFLGRRVEFFGCNANDKKDLPLEMGQMGNGLYFRQVILTHLNTPNPNTSMESPVRGARAQSEIK